MTLNNGLHLKESHVQLYSLEKFYVDGTDKPPMLRGLWQEVGELEAIDFYCCSDPEIEDKLLEYFQEHGLNSTYTVQWGFKDDAVIMTDIEAINPAPIDEDDKRYVYEHCFDADGATICINSREIPDADDYHNALVEAITQEDNKLIFTISNKNGDIALLQYPEFSGVLRQGLVDKFLNKTCDIHAIKREGSPSQIRTIKFSDQ